MRSIHKHPILAAIGAMAALGAPAHGGAQAGVQSTVASRATSANGDLDTADDVRVAYKFKSRADSIAWDRHRLVAARSSGFRIIVSLQDHHLWAVVGEDTVLSAPAATAKGTTLEFENSSWTFATPRGVRTVLGKNADPIWQPPEWLYAETAQEHDLGLKTLYAGHPYKLKDGRSLAVKDNVVGVIDGGEFAALPTDEHIVFDNTLFVPPLGTKNRMVEGELGKYRLNMGDGFLLHGTPFKDSIGLATTHGCVRLRDEDIEWLYEHVPVGTKVYIY